MLKCIIRYSSLLLFCCFLLKDKSKVRSDLCIVIPGVVCELLQFMPTQ